MKTLSECESMDDVHLESMKNSSLNQIDNETWRFRESSSINVVMAKVHFSDENKYARFYGFNIKQKYILIKSVLNERETFPDKRNQNDRHC